MLNKIKMALISLTSVMSLATVAAVPAIAHADSISDNVCSGAVSLNLNPGVNNCGDTNGSSKNFNDLLKKIINIFSVVVGIVAVVMIIVGGFRYITSGGEEAKVKGAKSTILYALIGLVVVALAQIIVKFVLNKATQTG